MNWKALTRGLVLSLLAFAGACQDRSLPRARRPKVVVSAPVDLGRVGAASLAAPLGGGAVDTPVIAGALGAQSDPAVAFDGSIYLAVWIDRRSVESNEIFAARVGADGALLDPVGIPIATGPGERGAVSVAAGGGAFLAVWQEAGPSRAGLRAVRISPQGTVLDAQPIECLDGNGSIGMSAAAFDGDEFRISWSPSPNSYYRQLLRISTAGELVGRASYYSLYDGTSPGQVRIPLACSGELCLTATSGGSVPSAKVLMVDRTGVARTEFTLDGATAPAVDFDGDQFLLVWQDDRVHSGRRDIYGMRIDPSGSVLDGGGFPIALDGDRTNPAVGVDGPNHLVVWEEQSGAGSDLLGARVAPDGSLCESTFLEVEVAPGAQRMPAVVGSAAGALVVFEDTRDDVAGDIRGARIGADGAVQADDLLVSTSGNREAAPAIAFDGTSWLAVWEDSRGATTQGGGIYGARLAADGTVLDGPILLVPSGEGRAAAPVVAGCGDGWAMAWEDRSASVVRILAARLSGDGGLRPPKGKPVSVSVRPQFLPAVACDAGRALVVWQESEYGGYPSRLAAARLNEDGATRDADGLTLSLNTAHGVPAVTAGPGGFVAAWEGRARDTTVTNGEGWMGEVLAVRVDGEGRVGTETPVCGGPGVGSSPALAFDGVGYQLLFEDIRETPGLVRRAALDAHGAIADFCGFPMPGSAGSLPPRIAVAADRALAVWQGSEADLVAAQLTPGGGVLGAQSIAPASELPRSPSVSCDPRGHCLVAYQRWDAAAGISRVSVRTVALSESAARCASASDCSGGYCVDGVCCDSACGGGDPADCVACSVAAGAPADGVCAPIAAGKVCRAGGDCVLAGRCDGTSAACPPRVQVEDGSWCDDGDACTQKDVCRAGACVGTNPLDCSYPSETCLSSACNHRTGRCDMSWLPDGARCDDGDPCTVTDVCDQARSPRCGGTPKSCPTSDACHAGYCDAATGECKQRALPDGTACDTGSACAAGGQCEGGACVGTPKVCPPPDACHLAGLCDRTTGDCVYTSKPDGTDCDDGSACTTQDACRAGVCKGIDAVVCASPDDCHSPGSCDPRTGQCSAPTSRPDGASCDDGDKCTVGDSCRGGSCKPGEPVVCPGNGPCSEAGTCDPATGSCTAPVPRPDGTSCEDGSPCTIGDACRAGVCQSGASATCPAPSGPCRVRTCDPVTGGCPEGLAPDGTDCSGGTCQSGECKAARKKGGGCEHGAAGDWALLLAVAGMAALRLRRERAARRPDAETILARIRERKERTGSRLSAERILAHRDAGRR